MSNLISFLERRENNDCFYIHSMAGQLVIHEISTGKICWRLSTGGWPETNSQ